MPTIQIVFSILFLTGMVMFTNAKPAYGEAIDLALFPPLTEVIATPGARLAIPLELTNYSKASQRIQFEIKSIKPANETGKLIFSDELLPPFLHLEKDGKLLSPPFLLRPDEKAKLDLTIDIPKEISEKRDYYAGVVFQTEHEASQVKTHVSLLTASLVSNIFLSILSNNQQGTKVHIKEFSIQPFVFGKPVWPVLMVGNDGDHFAKAASKIILYDVSGHELMQQPIANQYVLAHHSRNLTTSQAIGTENLLGRYTAKAIIELVHGESLETSTTFYVIPQKPLLLFSSLLIIVLLLIVRTRFYMQKRNFSRPISKK